MAVLAATGLAGARVVFLRGVAPLTGSAAASEHTAMAERSWRKAREEEFMIAAIGKAAAVRQRLQAETRR